MEKRGENSREISPENIRAISRTELAAHLRVDPKTVEYWGRRHHVAPGPWYTVEEARAAAAYHCLDQHLKSKHGAKAAKALPRPNTADYDIMNSAPLYLVFGRASSTVHLATSLAEVGDKLSLTEDVRVVQLDTVISAMNAHFASHATTVVSGTGGKVVPLQRPKAQGSA